MKWNKWKPYVIWIAIAEGVGALSGFLSRSGMQIYTEQIEKPLLSPPALVFPIVWVILYALMGISASRIYNSPASAERSRA